MKNYFYFSKGQKIGIVISLFIIIVFILIKEVVFSRGETIGIHDDTFMNEVAVFEESLKEKPKHSTLFIFNPNTLDSIGFSKLGLSPYVITNILKYRTKGGTFKNAQDFSKIYGLESSLFQQLQPYISIPQKKEKTFIIELNTCDTTELKKLKGIGSVLAQRIVKYRYLLGGFHSKEQLKEVYGITPEKYGKIEPHISTDKKLLRKIMVNEADVNKLKSHPYLNHESADFIYNLRRDSGKITATDLQQSNLNAETYEKILPYLSFE